MKAGQVGAMVLGGMLIGATAGVVLKSRMESPEMRRMYKKGRRVAKRFMRQINL